MFQYKETKLVLISFVSGQVCRLDGSDLRTFAQCGNSLIFVSLLACAVVAGARKVWKLRLCISGDYPLVVSQDDFVRSLRNHVLRHNRSLSAAARSVYYDSWKSVSRSMSSQSFDDLDTL